jgi:hypothetical protein
MSAYHGSCECSVYAVTIAHTNAAAVIAAYHHKGTSGYLSIFL